MKGKQCETCEAWLSSDAKMEEHVNGKRHQKALQDNVEAAAAREELGKRSIFLFGFPAHSFSEAALARHFGSNFGPVQRVLLGPKGTTAVLEFVEPDPAALALQLGKVKIGDQMANVKAREVHFESAGGVAEAEERLDELKAQVAQILESEAKEEEKVKGLVKALEMDDLLERTKAMAKLQAEMAPFLPSGSNIGVHGSCVSGLGLKGCDLDASLFYPEPPHSPAEGRNTYLRTRAFLLNTEPAEMSGERAVTAEEMESLAPVDRVRFLCRLINHLRKLTGLKTGKVGVTRLQPVLSKRCPTVTFVWERKYAADLSINNYHALKNAQWLGRLAKALPVYRELTYMLRFWGKTSGVVGGDQRVTSYALGLAILTFLRHDGIVTLDDEAITQLKDKASHQVLGELMEHLNGLEWKSTVLSPKRGSFIPLAEWKLGPDYHPDFKVNLINIQDPFDLGHNTAGQTAVKQSQHFWQELRKAAGRIKRHPSEPTRALFNLLQEQPRSSGTRTPGSGSEENEVVIEGASYGLGEGAVLCIKTALARLFRDVLDFDVADDDDEPMDEDGTEEPPSAKRPRVHPPESNGKAEVEVSVYWRSWQGRRLKRRAVERDNPKLPLHELEKKVTMELKETGLLSATAIMAFTAEVSGLGESDVLIRFLPHQGTLKNQDFANMSHFLKLFLPKCLPLLI